MKMFLSECWEDRVEKLEVIHPYDARVVDTVPRAGASDVERAILAAVEGAKRMRRTSGYDRSLILKRAAELIEERTEDLARTITLEEGKVIAEARFEVSRAVQTMILSAEEAKRISGEVLPLDGSPGAGNRLGFTLRVPCGVVLAISPFNFPLNLVAHKVGPALAAGNSVILKPATHTPLSALKLTEILLEAGLPPQAIQCLTGLGHEIGDLLCRDPRVRKISFTGSRDVGEHICQVAGIKRVTMELGSNAPLIVMPDADLNKVAEAVAVTGYSNAGQVCISTQRVVVAKPVYEPLLERLRQRIEAITFGDPLLESVNMGPMIREKEAMRVEDWIVHARQSGARLLVGGHRKGALLEPTVVADVQLGMSVSCEELFGPAVAVTPVETIDDGIALANDSRYGLSAGIFTENLEWAMKFAREVESGNLHINWGPQWRADLMPYGGLKESGFGKEGPKYAIQEMTELKTVVIHLT
ncbi:MAG: aldehyde dehydrogenase family protein [Terriglobia bacterium]